MAKCIVDNCKREATKGIRTLIGNWVCDVHKNHEKARRVARGVTGT